MVTNQHLIAYVRKTSAAYTEKHPGTIILSVKDFTIEEGTKTIGTFLGVGAAMKLEIEKYLKPEVRNGKLFGPL